MIRRRGEFADSSAAGHSTLVVRSMTGETQSTVSAPTGPRRTGGGFRTFLDAALCLYIAVILFRTFVLEGYIISTGSMAPALLGFHKRIVCPSCGCHFPFGIAVDIPGAAADTTGSESMHDGLPRRGAVRCPNCGQDMIDGEDVPANYGDQLLVQKNAYEFRRPHRWEVVVLNGPVRPVPPFVKRIVGLPNEAVQIIEGDIYADGRICRKGLDEQLAVRIPVFDNDCLPNDPPDGRGDWVIEGAKSPWRSDRHGFVASPTASKLASRSQGQVSWLAFQRWIRHGGMYKTEVSVDALPQNVHVSHGAYPQLRYDSATRRFLLIGALDKSERDRLLVTNTDPKVRAAIGELYNRSHDGPITDDYGYNRADTGIVPMRVRDIMLECDVALDADSGQVLFEIGDGRQTYRLTLDRSHSMAQLSLEGGSEPLRSVALPAIAARKPFTLELSIFDRQVIAAIDGNLLFPAWDCELGHAEPPRKPLRIGACGAAVRVSGLKVFRDIFYTRGHGRNAVDRPLHLGADEYFVLGDNSPISNDGRSWVDGAVRESQLIGKPLVVHLPSRPGEFTLFGHTRYIRIPDFSRMRYIR
jgi:signal peptidase I